MFVSNKEWQFLDIIQFDQLNNNCTIIMSDTYGIRSTYKVTMTERKVLSLILD